MTQPGSSQRSSPRILRPDRREQVEAAVSAVAVGARQTDRMDAGAWWAHVWDVEPIVVAKVHYVLPRRRCICCRKLITAAPPFGQVGTVAYGPEHQRRGDPLASEGNVPIEATAQLMPALLGPRCRPGSSPRAHERFADVLAAAGFDEMAAALHAEDVLCADEIAVNVVNNIEPDGQPANGQPQ